jgi:integrase
MFRRKGVFYIQDNSSGRQESLHTKDRAHAQRLLHAKNEAAQGPLLSPKLWPKVKWRKKRGISEAEHQRIISTECNPERRLYYKLLRETGGSQSDVVNLTSDNIDWENRILWFHRGKLKPEAEPARITIGPRLEALLRQLPAQGPLFPYWSQTRTEDRAAEFRRRCRILKLEGISVHCYRYGWAE